MSGVQDRVALITGGAQGIGAGIARRLALGGAHVAVLDLNQAAAAGVAKGIADAGGVAIAVTADVSKREPMQAAIDQVVDTLGGLHILVNNAGVLRDNLVFKMTDDDWMTVMDAV